MSLLQISNKFSTGVWVLLVTTFTASADTLWKDVNHLGKQSRPNYSLKLLPDQYRLLKLDERVAQQRLSPSDSIAGRAQKQAIKNIELPMPDGSSLDLQVSNYSVMPAELAKKYPNIKTYRIEAHLNNGIYGVLDLTAQGFHAMLYMQDGRRVFIDPRSSGSDKFYISYFDNDYHPADKEPHTCKVKGHEHKTLKKSVHRSPQQRPGTTLRTYRIAMTATGEYTTFHGGTVEKALSAMTTTISRVNTIYERDLAIKLELIANNNELIFLDADTDPFIGDDSEAMLEKNQTEVDNIIGTDNYDIGHIVSTGGSGLAGFGVVCFDGAKAKGVTGRSQPIGDPFDIDYVAHEIGHQVGGTHSFNTAHSSCETRSAVTALEPGGGTTIMAYAGICGHQNIQASSDAMFHSQSIVQISNFINDVNEGGICGTETAINNTPPVVTAGDDYHIPANTPFELIGSAQDANDDTLSYSWEQTDTGQVSNADEDTHDNAIFRTFLPTNEPKRTFPQLADILADKTTIGELLAVSARTLNFVLAVRDGKGISSDDKLITVHDSTGFKITSLNTATTLTTPFHQLKWDVAGTSSAPISCSNVDILLSTDGGTTFPILLADATANDGSEGILFPALPSSTNARLKVKCKNNIFFDISNADLIINIESGLNANTPILSHLGANNAADPGETIDILIPLSNQTTGDITNINAILSTSIENTEIISNSSSYTDLAQNQLAINTKLYQIKIPESFSCGSEFPITLDASFEAGGQSTKQFNLRFPTGETNTYKQTNSSPQDIPDSNFEGITSVISLSGYGAIPFLNINLDINIVHSYPGDISLKLTSPQGTTVQLKTSIRDRGDDVIGNYPKTLTPDEDLSTAFNGEDINGNWILQIVDEGRNDTGNLVEWSLNFDAAICNGPNQDTDNDNVIDSVDNCPAIANPDQLNTDNDSQGNACDSDDDNDGIPDTWEIEFGFNPLDASDATQDNDNDGSSNLEEYQNGTNPRSFPNIVPMLMELLLEQ
jgi:subtilisin-like proprotein convertase family protein